VGPKIFREEAVLFRATGSRSLMVFPALHLTLDRPESESASQTDLKLIEVVTSKHQKPFRARRESLRQTHARVGDVDAQSCRGGTRPVQLADLDLSPVWTDTSTSGKRPALLDKYLKLSGIPGRGCLPLHDGS